MDKKWLIIILFLATFLRLYDLGRNPPSLDWDEASLGYNAFSLLKTGKDEFGRAWPISIRSFEDYKPALYTYSTIPSITLFGLNEFAVRLPSAVFGVLTVLVTFFLVREMMELFSSFGDGNNDPPAHIVALLSSLLLAVSPWHIQFSRVAFESNCALFFVLLGALLFIKSFTKPVFIYLSVIAFSLSFYAYHSPRLVVPVLLGGWLYYFRQRLWRMRLHILLAAVLGFVLLIPFMKEAVSAGSARLSSVTVLTPEGRLEEEIKRMELDISRGDIWGKFVHNRRIVYAKSVLAGYLDHFNFDFLFLTGDAPDRHHARDMGMLYMWEAPFILFGVIYILPKKKYYPLTWWFIVAPLASAITTGTPHAVRALPFLPLYQIFTALGLVNIWRILGRTYLSGRVAVSVLLGIAVFVNGAYYLESYFIHTPREASKEWQYGYKEAVEEVKHWENGVDKIIMTYAYDQPHAYVLFYMPVDPAWYQVQWKGGKVKRAERNFGKFEFRRINWEQDQYLSNTLIIGTPGEIPQSTPGIVREIRFLNGEIAFRIVRL